MFSLRTLLTKTTPFVPSSSTKACFAFIETRSYFISTTSTKLEDPEELRRITKKLNRMGSGDPHTRVSSFAVSNFLFDMIHGIYTCFLYSMLFQRECRECC